MIGIGTIIVGAVTIILSKNTRNDDSYLLIVRCNGDAAPMVRHKTESLYQMHKLRGETITNDYTELVYQVKYKAGQKGSRRNEIIKGLEGVYTVNMVARSGETLG